MGTDLSEAEAEGQMGLTQGGTSEAMYQQPPYQPPIQPPYQPPNEGYEIPPQGYAAPPQRQRQ